MDIISRLNENSSKLEAVTSGIRAFVNGLIDEKSFVETDAFTSGNVFFDGSDALGEGVITGYATINDMPVYIFAQNFEVFKGSLSSAQATKIEKCIKMAIRTGTPFISIIDSAGARVGEGAGVLEGYARIIKSAADMRGIVPHIAVVKGASVGMMSAYANLADFVIMDSKNGYMSLNSPSVVSAKANANGNDTKLFGNKVMCEAGLCDLTFDTPADLKVKINDILDILSDDTDSADSANRITKALNKKATVENMFSAIADDGKYISLGNNNEVVTALARVNGNSVGIIATNGEINKGRLGIESFKKIKRFLRLLDTFSLPLITLVDSQGSVISLESEQNGLSAYASSAFSAVAYCEVPKIAVIYGNAIGIAYSLLASKGIGFDYVIAFAGASIAPLTADTAVNFMYLDEIAKAKNPVKAREDLSATYTEREGNPFISAKDGFVDNIIEPSAVRPYIASILSMLN